MSILDQIRHYRLPTTEEELMAARMAKLEGALATALTLIEGKSHEAMPMTGAIVRELVVQNGRALLAEAA